MAAAAEDGVAAVAVRWVAWVVAVEWAVPVAAEWEAAEVWVLPAVVAWDAVVAAEWTAWVLPEVECPR